MDSAQFQGKHDIEQFFYIIVLYYKKLYSEFNVNLTLLTYPHAEAAATYPLLFFQQLLQKA